MQPPQNVSGKSRTKVSRGWQIHSFPSAVLEHVTLWILPPTTAPSTGILNVGATSLKFSEMGIGVSKSNGNMFISLFIEERLIFRSLICFGWFSVFYCCSLSPPFFPSCDVL